MRLPPDAEEGWSERSLHDCVRAIAEESGINWGVAVAGLWGGVYAYSIEYTGKRRRNTLDRIYCNGARGGQTIENRVYK